MFSGDVRCVYCGLKITFLGNNITYQNQRCANHNQEHQFPGMNIFINKFDIISKRLLPAVSTTTTQINNPSALPFKTSDKPLHNHVQHRQINRKEQIVMKPNQNLPIAASFTQGHNQGNIRFKNLKIFVDLALSSLVDYDILINCIYCFNSDRTFCTRWF